MPNVSIFIPVFNTENYIGKAIESVLEQTYSDFELVIVDDCSSDNTYEICQKYARADDRIRLFRNAENLGMMPNWNHGLTLCRGEYWGKLDADDWWEKDFVERCVSVLETNRQVGLVCSAFDEIDENDKLISVTKPDFPQGEIKFLEFIEQGLEQMFSHQIARQGVGLIRYHLFKELGTFLLHDAGDTEFWYRIGCHYRIYYIPQLLHHHRIWSNNFTRQKVLSLGLRDKNLHEIRQAILTYYYKAGNLPKKKFLEMTKENRFEYLKTMIHIYRSSKRYFDAIFNLVRIFLYYPGHSVKYYLHRLRNKFSI